MINKNSIYKLGFYFLIILFLIFVFNYIKNNTSIKESFSNEKNEDETIDNFESNNLSSLENEDFESTETDLSNKNFLNAGYHSNINSNNKRTENLQLRPDPPVPKIKSSLSMQSN